MSDTLRKNWLHEKGICVNCMAVDAYTMAGRWLCAECAKKSREYQARYRMEHREALNAKQAEKRQQYISAGLCRSCGKPAYNGTTFCIKHLNENRQRRKKAEYRPENQCRWCDTERVPGKFYCEDCLKRKREIIANNRQKNKQEHPWNTNTKITLTTSRRGK